jgi:hypothetical protein
MALIYWSNFEAKASASSIRIIFVEENLVSVIHFWKASILSRNTKAKVIRQWLHGLTRGLENESNDTRREAAKFEDDRIEIDARRKDTASWLSLCLNKLDKLEKEKSTNK